MALVINAVQVLLLILNWLILARVILSFIHLPTYNRTFSDLRSGLYTITEPILAPIRRILPATPGMDLSPLIAVIVIGALRRLLYFV